MTNQENMTAWAEALESGEYAQCTGQLREDHTADGGIVKHCCLGVVTDLYLKARGGKWDSLTGSSGTLPQMVVEWLGLTQPDPFIEVQNTSSGARGPVQATWANDGLGLSFTEIAAAIRRTYLQDES